MKKLTIILGILILATTAFFLFKPQPIGTGTRTKMVYLDRENTFTAENSFTATTTIGSPTKQFKRIYSPDITPAGAVIPYAGATAPTGWLIADGSTVSRTTYADLFAVIADTYGVGDGSTTFNLPNLQGRIPVGLDATQTEFDDLGETGGEKTHQLTEAELAAHTHSIQAYASGGGGSPQGIQAVAALSISYVGSTGSIGSNTAHNNLQPYLTLNYIIKY